MFHEVDSPFFISEREAAERLVLHRIRLPHDICVDAGIGFGSEDYLIKEYAQITESDMQWSTDMLPAHLIAQSNANQKTETPVVVSTSTPVQITYANWSAQQNTVTPRTIPNARYIPVSVTPPECSWGLMLFYTVFFGWLGLHRFYAGKMKSGMLYIFTLGLFGVGWIVDEFAVLTTLFRDRYGRRIKMK